MSNATNEMWKDIDGYEGLYRISNFGRVLSVGKLYRNCLNNKLYPRREKLLKPKLNADGYYSVCLYKSKNIKKISLVHRLVACAFLANHENKPTVNHKDGCKTNNSACNLEWATKSEQTIHAYKNNLLIPYNRNGASNSAARRVVQKRKDGTIVKVWNCIKDAKNAGFLPTRISDVCRGKYKQHGGFNWEYA